jgi:hypothetical protein
MNTNLIDLVWSSMKDGELYSPEDLANWSLQPTEVVARVLGFLTRYGFIEQLAKRQALFRKLADAPDPCSALKVLQRITAENDLRDLETLT